MYLHKTMLASTIVLLMTGVSSVMAEKNLYVDTLPMEALPLIEHAPDGFFVGAPVVGNLAVMIVQVYNTNGEMVMSVRSKGESVEFLASGLPDGEYRYQVKTIYQLDVPVGEGPERTSEAMDRKAGGFSIKNNEIIRSDTGYGHPELNTRGMTNRIQGVSVSVLGWLVNAVSTDAMAATLDSGPGGDVYVTDNDPEIDIWYNANTSSNSGRILDWRIIGWDTDTGVGAKGFEIRDGLAGATILDIQPGTENHNAIQFFGNGDVAMANGTFSIDKSLPRIFMQQVLQINGLNPGVTIINDSTDTRTFLQTSGTDFNIWTTPNGGPGWRIPIQIDLGAPGGSFDIAADGDVTLGSGFYFDTTDNGRLTIGAAGPAVSGVELQVTDDLPTLGLHAPGFDGVQLSSLNGLVVDMDTDGDGFINTSKVLFINKNAPTNSLSVGSTGNVGVGTSGATEAIDLQRIDTGARIKLTAITSTANQAPQMVWRRARSNAGVAAAVQNNDNLGAFSFRGHDGTNYTGSRGFINVAATENWAPGANGTAMIFQTTRNGTASPAEVMRITNDGKVKINGVTLNVPDYVFEEDYELMTLDQLAAYIEENKHLPGVASAKEVSADGLDLAGSQLSVLEKVEELTLYTLQQHEELKQLEVVKAENEQLKLAHRELLTAYHTLHGELISQRKNDERLEQLVNQLMQSKPSQSIYTSLK